MATASPQIPRTARPQQSSPVKNIYLLSYNFASAVLWLTVLARVLAIAPSRGGSQALFRDAGDWTRWTQTLALLEVAHSLLGIVRAPFMTTAMQVASRILLVWGIGYNFPEVCAASPAYTSMLFAWACSEIIRYSYFVFFLGGSVPSWLTWLRYNAFYILYPIGISSECWLVWKSIGLAGAMNPLYAYFLYAVLAIYIPGSYILYTHMIAQRRRTMRGKQPARR